MNHITIKTSHAPSCYLMSISDVPLVREESVSVDSNRSALSRMKFCCIWEILAMIFSFLFAARRAFLFLAASFSSLLDEASCSTGPLASAELVICRTSINFYQERDREKKVFTEESSMLVGDNVRGFLGLPLPIKSCSFNKVMDCLAS